LPPAKCLAEIASFRPGNDGFSSMKKKPSAHQRQIRFFTWLFTIVLTLLVILLLWLLNRGPGGRL